MKFGSRMDVFLPPHSEILVSVGQRVVGNLLRMNVLRETQNAAGDVLYVGKARSLKKRVTNYAQGRGHTNRIGRMVRETDLARCLPAAGQGAAVGTRTDSIRHDSVNETSR